jgi:hypothetical protein
MIYVASDQLLESAGAPPMARMGLALDAVLPLEQCGLDVRDLAARFKEHGAPFKPFMLKFASPAAFEQVWSSSGGDPRGAFWRVTGHDDGLHQFRPLGDMVTMNENGASKVPAILLACDNAHPNALAHPVGFERLDDLGGNGSISCFRLVPPPGFSALGIALSATDVSDYWCVSDEFLNDVGAFAPLWTIGYPTVRDNGGLHKAAIGAADRLPMGDTMYILPNTAQLADHPEATRCAALRVCKLRVPIDSAEPGEPPFDRAKGRGAQWSSGLTSVMVLPCTAIDGRKLMSQASESPFYFVVSRPVWKCILTVEGPEEGSGGVPRTIGVAASSASEFRRATSLTVSPFGMVAVVSTAASVCVSLTQESGLMESDALSRLDKLGEPSALPLPMAPLTQFWQLFQRLEVFQGNSVSVASIDFGRDKILTLP